MIWLKFTLKLWISITMVNVKNCWLTINKSSSIVFYDPSLRVTCIVHSVWLLPLEYYSSRWTTAPIRYPFSFASHSPIENKSSYMKCQRNTQPSSWNKSLIIKCSDGLSLLVRDVRFSLQSSAPWTKTVCSQCFSQAVRINYILCVLFYF